MYEYNLYVQSNTVFNVKYLFIGYWFRSYRPFSGQLINF